MTSKPPLKPSRILPAVFAFVLLTCFASEARACSCMGERAPCQEYWESDAVFVGTATGAESVRVGEGESRYEQRLVRFAVAETLRGKSAPEAEVVTGLGDSDCGYAFRRGATYVVYANRSAKDGRLYTGICNRTRPLADADEDLAYARGLPTAPAGAAVYGEVHKRHQPRRDDEEPFAPVASAELTIEGGAKGGELTTRETKSDGRGKFRVEGLPPGAYTVTLKVPPGLTFDRPFNYKGDGQTMEREVKVAERGCAGAGFLLEADTRVGGRVLDATGRPLSNVNVLLRNAPSDKWNSNYRQSVRTGAEGRFEFERVPRGGYVLEVSAYVPRDEGGAGAGSDFLRTFYPGVPVEERAGVVNVEEGQHLGGLELRLPLRLTEYEVEGSVVRSDGRPAPGASVYLKLLDGGDLSSLSGLVELRADEQGRFTLKVYEGLRYKVTAIPPNVVGGRDPYSRWVDVPPAPGHPPLKLPALELIKK